MTFIKSIMDYNYLCLTLKQLELVYIFSFLLRLQNAVCTNRGVPWHSFCWCSSLWSIFSSIPISLNLLLWFPSEKVSNQCSLWIKSIKYQMKQNIFNNHFSELWWNVIENINVNHVLLHIIPRLFWWLLNMEHLPQWKYYPKNLKAKT